MTLCRCGEEKGKGVGGSGGRGRHENEGQQSSQVLKFVIGATYMKIKKKQNMLDHIHESAPEMRSYTRGRKMPLGCPYCQINPCPPGILCKNLYFKLYAPVPNK